MPDFVSDYYLTRQKNEVDWIRVAISAWGILAEPEAGRARGVAEPDGGEAEPTDEQVLHVRRKWVVSQLVYYIRSSYRDRISHLIYRQMAAGLIAVGIFTSIWLACLHLEEDRQWHGWGTLDPDLRSTAPRSSSSSHVPAHRLRGGQVAGDGARGQGRRGGVPPE